VSTPRRKSGFALISVLWLLTVASTLALAAQLTARNAVNAEHNRTDVERAQWRARDCIARARFVLDDALVRAAEAGATDGMWTQLSDELASSNLLRVGDCDVSMHTTGDRLDVNDAGDSELRGAFAAMHIGDPDALADRLLDWRDPDNVIRERGAERSWYLERGMHPPRNGRIASIQELTRIPGFEDLAAFDSVLGVEQGRVSLNTAPLIVLAAVPGMTGDLLARLRTERATGRRVDDLLALAYSVSGAAADSVLEHHTELNRRTTVRPDAWVIEARGWVGTPSLIVKVELRVALGQGRVVLRFESQERGFVRKECGSLGGYGDGHRVLTGVERHPLFGRRGVVAKGQRFEVRAHLRPQFGARSLELS